MNSSEYTSQQNVHNVTPSKSESCLTVVESPIHTHSQDRKAAPNKKPTRPKSKAVHFKSTSPKKRKRSTSKSLDKKRPVSPIIKQRTPSPSKVRRSPSRKSTKKPRASSGSPRSPSCKKKRASIESLPAGFRRWTKVVRRSKKKSEICSKTQSPQCRSDLDISTHSSDFPKHKTPGKKSGFRKSGKIAKPRAEKRLSVKLPKRKRKRSRASSSSFRNKMLRALAARTSPCTSPSHKKQFTSRSTVSASWVNRLRPRPLKSARFKCYRPDCLTLALEQEYLRKSLPVTPDRQKKKIPSKKIKVTRKCKNANNILAVPEATEFRHEERLLDTNELRSPRPIAPTDQQTCGETRILPSADETEEILSSEP
ncbi:unnamed protein product [Dicrocoelium dendriticum]|nr:unnamed protein product [Dicrocoelium dendriticum]